MSGKRKHIDEDTINISSSLLANLESILDSNPLLEIPDIQTQPLKEKSTLLTLKKPKKKQKKKLKKSKQKIASDNTDSIENDLDINIDEMKQEIEDTEEDPQDTFEETKTFVLELPREMLTAYILLCLKYEDDWKAYGICGQIGVLLAYAIPFGIQIIVTLALMSEVKLDKMRFDTTKSQLTLNICALSILFIYIFDKSIALLKSTWFYLNKLQKDKNNNNINSQVDIDSFQTQNMLDITPNAIVENVKDMSEDIYEEILDIKIETDIRNIKLKETDKRWVLFFAFKLQIICVFIMHFGLMSYALIQINTHKHLADKLEVAISIFFILEVDDWAYELFIAQNMILSDQDFAIELNLKTKNHNIQFSKNKKALWCSLILIIMSVSAVILGSVYLY
eukprot:72158_1